VGKAILGLSVETDRGLAIGPGPVVQGNGTVVKDVEEASQGSIAGVANAIPGVLGEV
jgi:hypothetical protein